MSVAGAVASTSACHCYPSSSSCILHSDPLAATMGSEREQQDDLSTSHANNNNGGNNNNNNNNNVKVYVRLRPMDKLEMNRRSKDCIELDDVNPKIVTVDSPHHGVRDFSFDMVS
jgi:hypothetical protein